MLGTYPAFDCHTHFNHGSPFDCPKNYAGLDEQAQRLDLDYARGEYARIGIVGGGFSTFASVMEHTECIEEENDYLFRLSESSDWIRQWVVVDPRIPATFRQADEMLDSPHCLGIKIHPTYHGYDVTEYADQLFSFAAARRAVVLMHPQKIPEMPRYADRYPMMTLIVAHLKGVQHVEAVRAAKNGNIWIDTSAAGVALNRILEYAVETVGSERILFGSDTYSAAFAYGRIALSGLSDTDKRNIFSDNARRLFPRALCDLYAL